jgi:polar amino acid transport system substrate-binding protein
MPIRLLRFMLFLLLACASSVSWTGPALATDRAVNVGVRVLPPFVVQQDGHLGGFSVDLWNAIAAKNHWTTHFDVVPNVDAQLAAVAGKKDDVAVGAVSITADRDLRYDFSQPILAGGLQILTRTQKAGPEATAFESLMHLLFSPSVLVWLGIAAVLTIVPAHIVWFLERRHPEGMIGSKSYFPGIFQAFFWGLGTLATQADSMPRHWGSRVVAILWMFTSVVFVAFYTATLTASLTVQSFRSAINGPDDLPGKAVATVAGTTSADYLRDSGVKATAYPNIDAAVKALTGKTADAVVYDAPVLQYMANADGSGNIGVVGPVFHAGDYGYALTNGSPLRKDVDAALLSLRESGDYDTISARWFGKKS